jgi:hypothetical protein
MTASWVPGQSRSCHLGSNGGQHPATPQYRTSVGAQPHESSGRSFVRSHMEVLAAADFFSVEVLTRRGLVTYYLLHDRDQKFCREFRDTLAAGGVQCLPLPATSPTLSRAARRPTQILQPCRMNIFTKRELRIGLRRSPPRPSGTIWS